MRSRNILLIKGRQVIVRVHTNSLNNLAEKPCPHPVGFEPENIGQSSSFCGKNANHWADHWAEWAIGDIKK